MPAPKLRKKTTRTSKAANSRKLKAKGGGTSKRLKVKAKAISRSKARLSRKPKQPPPHPDETTVRLGPHHVDRHPVPAGIQVHPQPPVQVFVPAATSHRNTVRHH